MVTGIKGIVVNCCKGLIFAAMLIPLKVLSDGFVSDTLTYVRRGDEAYVKGVKNSSLSSVTIPTTVGYEYAVQNNDGSTTMRKMTCKVTGIAEFAFAQSSLQNVTMNEGLKNIEAFAFSYCTSLTSITIPNSVTNIGGNAFAESSITLAIVGSGVTHIGECAFQFSDPLTTPQVLFMGKPPKYTKYYTYDFGCVAFNNVIGMYLAKYKSEWEAVISSRWWYGLYMYQVNIISAHAITFNAMDGVGSMDSQEFEDGKKQKLAKNLFEKDGYVFQGWAKSKSDADNGIVEYQDEEEITIESDMTLYAVWAAPALTLAAESADWSSGSITLRCEDADTSGRTHTYTLQYYDEGTGTWKDVSSVQSASATASLTDAAFSSRLGGIPTVKYRVKDENGRVSAECVTRNKYGIFVGLSHYSPSYQTYLTENSGSPLTEDEHGRNAAYAASFCELAKTNGQLDSNNCFLLQDSLATYSNVSAAFNTILNDRKIKPGDICMLYFATHGTAKSSTTTGGIYLYDKPNLGGADFYQEELLANHIKSLDPNEKGVAVVGILSACHSGAFIDSSAEQVCQYGWCQDQGLSDINVAWITAADVNSVSYGIFSDFLINYGWDNGWAWKKSGRGQDDKVVSFYDLADYAIDQFQPIATRREISGGKIKNDTMLKNIIAGTSIGPSSSLSAPGNPINVKASPDVPNAESPNKVVVTWEQGMGGTPSEYYVIRRRKNTGEYLATLIGTKDRKIDAEDAATRDNPMQYYIVAVNGAGVAVSEVPAEGWRSDVFIVELDVDGGTLPLGTETPMSVSVSSPTIQNLPTPDKYGYEFSGWFWDSERTRTVTLGSQISRDVVIHAKWISIPRYTVAFKYALPGISYVSPPQIVYSNFMRGTKLGDKVITDTKSIAEEAINAHEIRNYVFKGWFSECYGRGVQATKDTVVVNDAEYFAYWEWNGSEPPMPQVWLDSHSTFAAASNGETLRAAAMTAANGCRTVAECYALGIDPEDPNDDLKITDFKMEDGKPVITLNHTKDGSGISFESRIKTLGKANLSDADWIDVTDKDQSAYRFFKVTVDMP